MYSLSEIRASRSLEGTDGGIKDISAGQQDQGMLAGELAPTPESLWRQGWELPELFLAREPSTGIICCGHKRRSGEGIFSLWKLLRNLHLAASNLFQTGFLSQERESRAVSLCGPTVNSFLAKNNVLSVKTSQKSRTVGILEVSPLERAAKETSQVDPLTFIYWQFSGVAGEGWRCCWPHRDRQVTVTHA